MGGVFHDVNVTLLLEKVRGWLMEISRSFTSATSQTKRRFDPRVQIPLELSMMVISEKDVRAMVRLLGETAALGGGHAEKKRHLMGGLCELINADAWVWTLGCQIKPNEPQVFVGFLHGGFDDTRFSRYLEAVEHKDMGRIASRFAENLQLNKGITTMRRDEMDPDGEVYKSDAGLLWEKADIGSLMLTGYPLDEASISCAAFYRKFNDDLFGER